MFFIFGGGFVNYGLLRISSLSSVRYDFLIAVLPPKISGPDERLDLAELQECFERASRDRDRESYCLRNSV
jgi:hypothetical protein